MPQAPLRGRPARTMRSSNRPAVSAVHGGSVLRSRLRPLRIPLVALCAVHSLASSCLGASEAPRWTIENRSPQCRPAVFAAEELARYLTKTAGADAEPTPPTGGPLQVVLGLRDDLHPSEAALLPPPAKGYDGYAVAVTANADGQPLWVIGGDDDRGVLYGSYDVLERLGWRWFHPQLDPDDSEVRPETGSLDLPAATWAIASPMRTRGLIWYVARLGAGRDPPEPAELRAQIDWLAKNRYNALEHRALEAGADHPLRVTLREEAARRGIRLQAPGHNFDLFFPDSAENFAEHPEWFGERDGRRWRHKLPFGAQFCWTNEGAIQRFLAGVEAFVETRPELDVLTLSPLDSAAVRPCACETCAKSSVTDRYLALANRVVERLAKTAPDVTVEVVVGYQHIEDLPETAEPDGRLRGRYARWGRSVAVGFDEDPFGRVASRWSQVFPGRLTSFQYYSDHFAGPLLPMPYTKQIAGDRKALLQMGANGMTNLVYPSASGWWHQSLDGYLAGRAFYDASLQPADLLADYARRYHGPEAGPLMEAYYREISTHPLIGRQILTVPTRPTMHLIGRLTKEHIEPAVAAAGDDPTLRHRMEKARRWHALVEELAARGIWLGEARRLAQEGNPKGAKAAVARAEKQAAQIEKLWRETAGDEQGIADLTLFLKLRKRFDKEVERTVALIDAAHAP